MESTSKTLKKTLITMGLTHNQILKIIFCAWVMWDSPLCAVNMFYCHWLIKKLLWPMTGQNRARQESETECREKKGRVRQSPCTHPRSKM